LLQRTQRWVSAGGWADDVERASYASPHRRNEREPREGRHDPAPSQRPTSERGNRVLRHELLARCASRGRRRQIPLLQRTRNAEICAVRCGTYALDPLDNVVDWSENRFSKNHLACVHDE